MLYTRISKNYFKYWWNEKQSILKQAFVEANNIWKDIGRQRHGPVFDKRQSRSMVYRKCLRQYQNLARSSYSNNLHENLLKKDGDAFWKCWRSNFDSSNNRCTEVEQCVDPKIITEKFVNYFKNCFTCNNADRMEELQR